MRYHHPAVRDVWRRLGQYGRDILIGKAVEPVSPDPGLMKLARQRKGLREFGYASVKCRVEAGNLRQIRIDAP